MPIRIRDSADPLSERALRGDREVIIARSEAARVLRYELIRYCNGQIQGRSFLIAGHRGAGKTTMVADALYQTLTANRNSASSLRPLPIFLHGPSLLETLPSDLRRDDFSLADTNVNGKANGKSSTNAKSDQAKILGACEPGTSNGDAARKPAAACAGQGQALNDNAAPPAGSAANDNDADCQKNSQQVRFTAADEKQAQLALVHLILSLHRAVVKEYATAYRQRILQPQVDVPGRDAGELAAQFEIELFEDPPASRLREYWQYAAALTHGILFDGNRPQDQGARELVAINGICNAHQRISGALSQTEQQKRDRTDGQDTVRGFDAKAVDALKPLGAVFAGAAVAGGAAIGSPDSLGLAGLLGVAAAWLSSMFLKTTITTSNKRERHLDRIFIPDLTPRTLDRVLPMLLDRLREAGLAPVLIIDELDKVDDLARRIENMIRYLKKLMAENVFSCFLTDRGYLEYLRMDRGDVAYGLASSYFSHRLLVAYTPKDLDAYLTELLEATDQPDDGASVDCEVLKWVLRHRSQLHALTLSRELAAIRGDDGHLNIPPGDIRTGFQYRIDVTLQMAIELQLYSREVVGWSQRQQEMRQTLFDTLYYLSRSWLRGDQHIDMSAAGKKRMIEELQRRMNLREACAEEQRATSRAKNQKKRKRDEPPDPLAVDDIGMLSGILDGIVRFLSPLHTRKDVDASWQGVVKRLRWRQDQLPVKEVMSALLLEEDSLLKPAQASAEGAAAKRSKTKDASGAPAQDLHEWRYWRSGLLRDPRAAKLQDSEKIRQDAAAAVDYITLVESSLLSVLASPSSPEDIQVFNLLSEGCRVLNTTPAWSQVRAAITNLTLLKEGAGNPASIESDCRVVEDFEKVLREGEQTVLKVVLAASVLRGVSDGGQRPLTMQESVAMLSAGLGFARLDSSGVRARAEAFWAELGRAYGQHGLNAVDPDGKALELTGKSFAPGAAQFLEKGRTWSVNWDEQRTSAWKSVERRLDSQEAGNGQQFANLPEILCAAGLVGPSPVPGLDLDRIPLDVWTSILLDTVVAGTPVTGKEIVPPWLAAFALRHVGAHNLAPPIVDRLFTAINASQHGIDARFRALIRAEMRGGLSGLAAIVVRNPTNSLTNVWTTAPTLGMVWVVDVHRFIAGHPIELLKKVLPDHPLLVVWEEPAESPTLQSEGLARYMKSDDDRVQTLYMYPRARMATKAPALVDPSGPDTLFRRARAGERPRS